MKSRCGHCELFYMEKFVEELGSVGQKGKKLTKTLMFFEGCPRPLGCTVLLKGSNGDDLKKVKRIVQYAIFAAYQLSLETSYLVDEGATLLLHSPSSVGSLEKRPLNFEHGNTINEMEKAYPVTRLSIVNKVEADPERITIQQSTQLHPCIEAQAASALDKRNLSHDEFPPSPSDHQILVSFSSSCFKKGTVCERGLLFRIRYYGSFDQPLGRFLRNNVFDLSSVCGFCEETREAHMYCYMHRESSLIISVRKQDHVLAGESEGKIWMWHSCLKCPRANNVPPPTHRILMSDAAWGLSFGKFLELSFSNHAAASRVAACGHSLHRDCLRFYGFGSTVACFRYAPLSVHTVCLPPPKLEFNNPELDQWLLTEVHEISEKGKVMFTKVFDMLHQLEEASASCGSREAVDARAATKEYECLLSSDQKSFAEMLQKAAPMRRCPDDYLFANILELNSTRRNLAIMAARWNQQFHHLQVSLKLEKFPLASRSVNLDAAHVLWERKGFTCGEQALPFQEGHKTVLPSYTSGQDHEELSSLKNTEAVVTACSTIGSEKTEVCTKREERGTKVAESKRSSHACVLEDEILSGNTLAENSLHDFSDTFEAAWTGKGMAVEAHAVNILPNGQEIISHSSPLDASSNDEEVSTTYGIDLVEATTKLKKTGIVSPSYLDVKFCPESDVVMGNAANLTVQSSVEKLDDSGGWIGTPFSSFYRSYSKNYQSTPTSSSPKNDLVSSAIFPCEEARVFLPLGIDETVIPVYDDEPTSIIAYAITSRQYQVLLSDRPEKNIYKDVEQRLGEKDLGKDAALSRREAAVMHPLEFVDGCSEQDDGKSSHADQHTSSSVKNSRFLQYSKATHVKVSFMDDSTQGRVKYTVTCYYARQFDALRENCCPNQMDFVRSLCRCKKWGAGGGKSNVYFAKTADDRFVVKQVTKTELESFIKFAPEYFKYLSDALATGSPTCLAKIIGIFQVTIKQGRGGKDVRMDLMTMENLLYGRHVARLYDLKGSLRSRYNADITGKNKVLLDENLLESMSTNPIFIGNKAKRLLERAIWNDTSFLASADVMDYSLLVGVDEQRQELVLGIIDFLRQYTWDKHLETWVKASGILGGPKHTAPTIISPKQYKKRFRKAMKKYFLVVPDQWSPSIDFFPQSCSDSVSAGSCTNQTYDDHVP